jgi:hypothetical protein
VRNARERRAGRPHGRILSGGVVGQPAPSFRLPSAQGPAIALEEFRGNQEFNYVVSDDQFFLEPEQVYPFLRR